MYNILVVDDKEVFRRKIARMNFFREHADSVKVLYSAQNGVEALEVLEKYEVDIVLTDIRMPFVDGLELLAKANKKKLCKCIILISEYSDFAYAKEGIVHGAFDYIVKPVDEQKISTVLSRAITYLDDIKNDLNQTDFIYETIADDIIQCSNDLQKDIDFLIDNLFVKNLSEVEYKSKLEISLKKVNAILVKKNPYIVKYIPLNEIWNINQLQFNIKQCKKDILEKANFVSKQINMIFVKTDSKIISDICNYIVENVEKQVSLQMITEEFFLNKKYLSSLFYKKTNIHYAEYVSMVKIERAKMLLSYSDMKIYEIAVKLGFSDTEYFSKVFKKKTGNVPSDFNWGTKIVTKDF